MPTLVVKSNACTSSGLVHTVVVKSSACVTTDLDPPDLDLDPPVHIRGGSKIRGEGGSKSAVTQAQAPPGPYPLADLDPPSQIWTPHQTFLFPNLFKLQAFR